MLKQVQHDRNESVFGEDISTIDQTKMAEGSTSNKLPKVMHYLVFTKRQLQVQHQLDRPGTPTSPLGITKLYDQGKNLEVCMIQGDSDRVYEAYAELQLRPDLLVTQVLSGEMELANSSVNTWLWRQFSRINVQAPSTPSH